MQDDHSLRRNNLVRGLEKNVNAIARSFQPGGGQRAAGSGQRAAGSGPC